MLVMVKLVRVWLRIPYRCCGLEWSDDWPEPFRLECPDCGLLVEAHSIVEIPPPEASEFSAATPANAASLSAGRGR